VDGNDLSDRGFTGHYENREIGLTYMQARYYAPYLNRFISPDTIVPDPANPQSFNRYSYALNNPVNLVDPSGHWACKSDANQADCEATIQAWLDMLANDGGDVAHGLFLWFMEYDAQWLEKNGIGITFEFKTLGFGAQVPFCGGSTGLCAFSNDGPRIEIKSSYLGDLSGDTGKGKAALLAHEFVHLYDGDIDAASTLGEATAYFTESMIRLEFGLTLSGLRNSVHGKMQDDEFGYFELAQFKRDLVNAGYPKALPAANRPWLLATDMADVVASPSWDFWLVDLVWKIEQLKAELAAEMEGVGAK
jgi:RHS repeat-associated protein